MMIAALVAMLHCTASAENKETNMDTKKKILVTYFSRSGENYSVGNVKEGNTKVLAGMIADQLGADLFEIEPVKAYPADYQQCTEVAKEEVNAKARPAIKADKATEAYDVIFIG